MSWTLDQVRLRLRRGDFRGAILLLTWVLQERILERRYGIRSSQVLAPQELGTDPEISESYDPTSYTILGSVLRLTRPPNAASGQAFLDVGSGMGRVALGAARQPYAKVIGIEASPRLVEQARVNFERCRARLRCQDVEFIVCDAAQYQVPGNVTTVFLYNPFRGDTLRRFMDQLRQSLLHFPRVVAIIFVNPVHFNVQEYPWLQPLRTLTHFHPCVPGQRMRSVIYTCGDAERSP